VLRLAELNRDVLSKAQKITLQIYVQQPNYVWLVNIKVNLSMIKLKHNNIIQGTYKEFIDIFIYNSNGVYYKSV